MKSSQSLCSIKDFDYFCIELFDSIATQSAGIRTVAKSLPLFSNTPLTVYSSIG